MSKLSQGLKNIERGISSVIPHQHSADRRAQQQAINEQIQFYKEQKELMEQEAGRVKSEREQERKRMQEKQVRSLRRAFRAPGFMDESSSDFSDKMGS